jgi:hypothetical protein
MNRTENDELKDLKDFLLECHIATGDILNLAESLQRSVRAIEFENAVDCPDRILLQVLAERIGKLNEQIGEAL